MCEENNLSDCMGKLRLGEEKRDLSSFTLSELDSSLGFSDSKAKLLTVTSPSVLPEPDRLPHLCPGQGGCLP